MPGIFIADLFHTIVKASSIIFDLCQQFLLPEKFLNLKGCGLNQMRMKKTFKTNRLGLCWERFLIKDEINPYNCLLKSNNFSVKTTNDYITSYIIK